MKQRLKDLLLHLGYSVTKSPTDNRVAELVERLHPRTTDRPLIRIGGNGDGGYLVPDDLDGIDACFSPGVDVTASFESEMVRRGVPCFLADASVPHAPIDGPLVDFEKKFIGVVDDGDFITIESWVEQKLPGRSRDLLLQMDIEGAEWPVLLNMPLKTLLSFRILVLELHHLNRVFDSFGFEIIKSCLDRLLASFYIVHLHPNNVSPMFSNGAVTLPHALEATMIRKDRATVTGYATSFPHPLDVDNVARRRHVVLPSGLHHPAQG
jgi:hypothetical protein